MTTLVLDATTDYGSHELLDAALLELRLRRDTLVLDARQLMAPAKLEASQFIEYMRLLRRVIRPDKRWPRRVLLGGPAMAAQAWPQSGDGLSVTWDAAVQLVTLRHRVPLLPIETTVDFFEGDDGWDYNLFLVADTLTEQVPKSPLTRLGRYSYSGHPTPLVVFAGDRLSPVLQEAVWHDWPFAMPSGSSAFLSQALAEAGLLPALHQVGFTNVNDQGGELAIRKLQELSPGLGFVALGNEAQRALLNLGIKPAMHAHHPQYARRFRFNELRQYGQELLEGYHLGLGVERDLSQRP